MTTLEGTPLRAEDGARDLRGIVQVLIPVSDLAISAAWYRDVLGLEYAREFSDGHEVTGCALADFGAHYMVALRRRDTTAGRADLRGEHPLIVEAVDEAAAHRIQRRARARGIGSTSGEHADASWIEFLDPDGIALRVVYNAAGPQHFMGVAWTDAGPTFYFSPTLDLAG